jgi:hypothetical protein
MKSIGNIAKYTLLALWLISVALAISIGIKQAAAFTADGRVIQKNIMLLPTDTLHIKFKHNDYAKTLMIDDFKIAQDAAGANIIYSNDVRFRIEKYRENKQIERNQLRQLFHYRFKNKFRNQEIEITLYFSKEHY